jgi:hypothetical protein
MSPVFWTLGVGLACAGSGCSSSADEPPCLVNGTYTVTGVRESGNCDVPSEPVTDTFTTLSDVRVSLEIQGLPDLSPIGTMNGCTWTASGAFTVTDATGPDKRGTLQYSYTFNQTGLSGIVSMSLPPAKSLPNGCKGTTKVSGTRR